MLLHLLRIAGESYAIAVAAVSLLLVLLFSYLKFHFREHTGEED
jgi:hypothetical protein